MFDAFAEFVYAKPIAIKTVKFSVLLLLMNVHVYTIGVNAYLMCTSLAYVRLQGSGAKSV